MTFNRSCIEWGLHVAYFVEPLLLSFMFDMPLYIVKIYIGILYWTMRYIGSSYRPICLANDFGAAT